jgi:hypothetical protein
VKNTDCLKIDIDVDHSATMFVGVVDMMDIIQILYIYQGDVSDLINDNALGYIKIINYDKDLNITKYYGVVDENKFTYKIDCGSYKKGCKSPSPSFIEELLRSKINVSRVAFLDVAIKCKSEYI